MNESSKIYIAGHKGMVGSAIKRKLEREGYKNLLLKNSQELDLKNQKDVNAFFKNEKPEIVILAAAKVGGIVANNSLKAEFIYDNLMIETNVIHASYKNNVDKLLFLGSSCIYPKFSEQPIKEDNLLGGFLEPTNQSYAIAKIAGIELCDSYRFQYGCNFISGMPTNLYGTNDNYHPLNSHVLPALIRKFVTAKRNKEKTVTIWGDGSPRREFLHVDDLAEACYFLLRNYNDKGPINIGFGEDISILELARLIQSEVGFEGKVIFDLTKPNGTPRKLLDTRKINEMGWEPKIPLIQGLRKTIIEFETLVSSI